MGKRESDPTPHSDPVGHPADGFTMLLICAVDGLTEVARLSSTHLTPRVSCAIFHFRLTGERVLADGGC